MTVVISETSLWVDVWDLKDGAQCLGSDCPKKFEMQTQIIHFIKHLKWSHEKV